MDKPVKLEQSEIAAIERTLAKGERVELIPVKDGVKVVRVRRDEIKPRVLDREKSLKPLVGGL